MTDPGDAFELMDEFLLKAAASLAPAKRKILCRNIARELRKRNQKRISQQVDPDGEPWEPRKPDSNGRVRSTAKLLIGFRAARRMRINAGVDGATLGYSGRNAKIASIHHYGLVAEVGNNAQPTKYPARRLLGLSDDDERWVREYLLGYISEALP